MLQLKENQFDTMDELMEFVNELLLSHREPEEEHTNPVIINGM